MKSRTHRLGKLQSFKKNPHGLIGETPTGHFQVSIITDTIFQIIASPELPSEVFSYAVVQQPQDVKFQWLEDDESISIETSKAKLKITEYTKNIALCKSISLEFVQLL